jgi:nucleotide-binding universal stress UspA family protein
MPLGARSCEVGLVQWIVALGLDGHANGAARFASWVTDRATDHVHGVHVLRRSEHFALAERALAELAASTGTSELFDDLRVVDHADVLDALVEACAEHAADMLVLGRRPRRTAMPVRLGRVARRVLRTLPGPVAVVPGEFEPARAGTGPVLVATDLGGDSAAACRCATRLARRIERSVVPVHVVADPHDWGIGVLTEAQVDAFADELRTAAEAGARAWCRDHRLGEAGVELRMGDVVDQLGRVAQERDAALVVLGSRRLGLVARLFSSSVGSALAATAPCPVVVVPPDPR